MSRYIVIRQADGRERHLDEHDLPLKLGSQADCHIILPGIDSVAAYIGDARGHLFIQPAENSSSPLLHNDRLLTDSTWLKSNDELRCESFAVEYRRSGDRVTFSVIGAAQKPVSPGLSPPPLQSLSGDSGMDIPVDVNRPRKTGPGKKIAFGLVGLGGFLLACAVIFVVLARPLQLQVTPEPETISISGFPPVVKLGSRYLALPGSYVVKISRQGYRDYSEDLVISRDGDNRLRVTLEKLPGILNLDLTPADGVSVFSGDMLLGKTPPSRIEIGPGTHLLSLKKERYQPYRLKIDIEGGGVEQDLSARLDPDWAEITITSEPAGAQVLIDGASAGQTPLTAELLSGNHRLMLSKELFISNEQTIEVKANINADYRFPMEPQPGRLQLSSKPAGAVVTIDNEYRGVTPLVLSLAPGAEQMIQLSHPGHKTLKHSVELSPGEKKELELSLEPECGHPGRTFAAGRTAEV
ncbi:MAG: PEGA domain-containing protein [Desulfofustis sp.]